MEIKILPKQIWIHNKTGNTYINCEPAIVINATNENDGQEMIVYHRQDTSKDGNTYVRERNEFLHKFSITE